MEPVEASENALFAGAPPAEAVAGESVPLLSDEFTPSQQAALRNEFLPAQAAVGSEAAGDTTSAAAAVRAIVARLTETPPNFHQATAYFASTQEPDDAPVAARAWMLLLGSTLMVMMQTFAAVGVTWGVVLPFCSTTEQCSGGEYCSVGGRSRCDFCGRWVPLEVEFQAEMSQADIDLCRSRSLGSRPASCIGGRTLNWAEDPLFIGYNLTLVAEVCAVPAERRGTRGNGDNNKVYAAETVASWCTFAYASLISDPRPPVAPIRLLSTDLLPPGAVSRRATRVLAKSTRPIA
eukprot:SAG22_NODE_1930_length_3292_cov_5.169120_2_plen_291_part_01